MPSMASSIHPDFRDDVTSAEAHAVDRETERLIHQQMAADNASGRERYIQLAKEMLRIRLRAYKPESPPVAGAWCLIGSAHLKASQLQEAKEATEKSLEIYAKGDDKDAAALAREQLGLIFEGLGQIPDAKNIRLQGASDGTMVCSSPRCPYAHYAFRVQNDGRPGLFKLAELNACGACNSAFYCERQCQLQDWKRHKVPCKAYTAAQVD
ncbi:uncharacterized protein J4E87_010284 [Alternaria ethzedia]|uniref:uncharacterized protein n=1 Tax=Alternaria ethzedia TaxID=181014 RepID=UPI0020C40445|nr:uncharacterized protein J4E87_010284 [Alternaria ethzedia]KAI4612383.1 hypothetical protein J4E87_010284 [Alternaria ethzedia]